MIRIRPVILALSGLISAYGAGACRNHESPPVRANPKTVTLRIGTVEPVRSLNILFDSHLAMLSHLSHPPLFRMAADGRIRGLSAAEADPSDDLRSWTIRLRAGRHWSDGRPVTAEDAAFTLSYLREHYPPAAWMRGLIADATAADPSTLTIRLTRPYSRLDMDLTTYKILPRHVWSAIPDPIRETRPGLTVGCGPFFIEDIDLDRGRILFIRNPVWPGPRPRIDEIEILLFKNRDVLALALERGDIDIPYVYADSFPYASLERFTRSPRFRFLEGSAAGLYFLGFNLTRPPMSDLRFREAVAAALDPEEIVRLFLLGHGRIPDRGLVPDTVPHFRPHPRWRHDPGRAADLLDAAGLPDFDGDGRRGDESGHDLDLVLLAASEHARLSELVRGQLRAVGLPVSIRTVDGATWTALKDDYEYDIILAKTSPWGLNMHAGWGTGYFDARRSGEGVLHTVDDPDFLDLCDRLLTISDESTRAALAAEVQGYYSSRLPAVALCWNTIIIPHDRRFTGWVWDPLYGFFNQESFLRIRRADQ